MGQREHLARWLRYWAAAMRRHCPARPAGFRTFPPWANGSTIPLAQPNPVAALGQWEYFPTQFLRHTPSSPLSSPRSRTRHSSAVLRATQPDVAAWVLACHAILRGTVIRGSGLPADVLCGIQERSGRGNCWSPFLFNILQASRPPKLPLDRNDK